MKTRSQTKAELLQQLVVPNDQGVQTNSDTKSTFLVPSVIKTPSGVYFSKGALSTKSFKIQPTAKINQISDSIETLIYSILDYLLNIMKGNELPEGSSHEILDGFMSTDEWNQRIALWNSLGVHYQENEEDPLKKNSVNILIKRDSHNRAYSLDINLNTTLLKCDANLIRQNLNDIISVLKLGIKGEDIKNLVLQADILSDRLQKATDIQRIQLLNTFNHQWEGKFLATYSISSPENMGNCHIVASNGQCIYTSYRNHVTPNGSIEQPALEGRLEPRKRLK